jgi:hypothetical protein
MAGKERLAKKFEIAVGMVQHRGQRLFGEDMNDYQLNLFRYHPLEKVKYRTRCCFGALQRHDQTSDVAWYHGARRHENHRLVQVSENAGCDVPEMRALLRGARAKDGCHHVGGVEGVKKSWLDRTVKNVERGHVSRCT